MPKFDFYIAGIEPESIVNGPNIRTTIFVSGCNHNCPDCHNKEAQNFYYGEPYTYDKLYNEISKILETNPLIEGITLSGGDPLYHPIPLIKFLKKLYDRFPGHKYSTWLYTGFVWENIMKDNGYPAELCKMCDVVVDGLYEKENKDYTQSFRGSYNQRFIDVPKTIVCGKIVEWENNY